MEWAQNRQNPQTPPEPDRKASGKQWEEKSSIRHPRPFTAAITTLLATARARHCSCQLSRRRSSEAGKACLVSLPEVQAC